MSSEQITDLTPEQWALIPGYREKYKARGLSTDRTEYLPARESVQELCKTLLDVDTPHVLMFDGPLDAHRGTALFRLVMKEAAHCDLAEHVSQPTDRFWAVFWQNLVWALTLDAEHDEKTAGQIATTLTARAQELDGGKEYEKSKKECDGAMGKNFVPVMHWASWVAWYKFPHEHVKPIYEEADYEKLLMCERANERMFAFYATDELCCIIDRPLEIHVEDVPDSDGRVRLHNIEGPAMTFMDGRKVYVIHDIAVEPWVFEEPVDVKRAMKQDNAEVRRVVLEKYLLEDGDALLDVSTLVDTAGDTIGNPIELYKITLDDGGEPSQFIRVLNSTREPDGTYKTYYLWVDRNAKTALEGVASTFPDLKESLGLEYAPLIET